MGSITAETQGYCTLSHPVHDEAAQNYDPTKLAYNKAPEHLLKNIISRRYPIDDIRTKVFDKTCSLETSRKYLKSHGYTAVKHQSALHKEPFGQLSDFRDISNINETYYPEIESLVKQVTGCEKVFIENSIVRGISVESEVKISDDSWKRVDENSRLRMHMHDVVRPVRVPHWDYAGRGAREAIRKLSTEMAAHAKERGIIDAEDAIATPMSAFAKESDDLIAKQYSGPRYAFFSIWRPIKKVTRDPLAMTPFKEATSEPSLLIEPHTIRLPGEEGDWYRDVPVLRANPDFPERSDEQPSTLHWEYVSDLDIDEVLFIKLYDTAALEGQAEKTGESHGVPHASPDLGELAAGDKRESIEVRVMCFW